MPIPSKCEQVTSASKIKVEELGRKAVFLNPTKAMHRKIQVDGCVIRDALAADWVLSKDGIGDVIVELKGKNVEHGAKQCLATAQFWSTNGLGQGRIAALIICRQYPHTDTGVQVAQDRFRREYKGPLHVVTGRYEFDFERVLSFKGPR